MLQIIRIGKALSSSLVEEIVISPVNTEATYIIPIDKDTCESRLKKFIIYLPLEHVF